MTIPMLDVKALHAPLREALQSTFAEVLDSGMFINGPYLDRFESSLTESLGRPALGVSSGSDALIIALMALGVQPGDEIITTPFTFFATVGAIRRLGATPVFADIDPHTFNLDPSAVEAVIGPKTVGILPVSLFGQTADLAAFEALAQAHGLWLVEDAAQSIGAAQGGRPSGTFGTMGTFSFFPAKNLGALGDGGAVVCQDEAMRETLRILRNHGGATMYHYEKIGGNFRLDALQAAFLSTKLPHLAQWETQRRQNASLYDARFAALPGIKTPVVGPGCHHVYNQYVLRFTDGSRDQAQAQLKEQGVASAIYYPLCLHLQTCFADLGGKEGDFPQAERASREVLAIPVLTDRPEEVIKAVEATR